MFIRHLPYQPGSIPLPHKHPPDKPLMPNHSSSIVRTKVVVFVRNNFYICNIFLTKFTHMCSRFIYDYSHVKSMFMRLALYPKTIYNQPIIIA